MKALVACPLYEGSVDYVFDYCLMMKRNRRNFHFDTLFIFNWAVMNPKVASLTQRLEADEMRYYTLSIPMDVTSREREGLSYQIIQNHAIGHDYDYLIIVEHDVRFCDRSIGAMVQLLEKYNHPVAGFHPNELYKEFSFDPKKGIKNRVRYTWEELQQQSDIFRAYTTWCCMGFPAWALRDYPFRWDIQCRNHADSFFAHDYGMVLVSKTIPYLHIRKPWSQKPLKP